MLIADLFVCWGVVYASSMYNAACTMQEPLSGRTNSYAHGGGSSICYHASDLAGADIVCALQRNRQMKTDRLPSREALHPRRCSVLLQLSTACAT